MRDPLAIIMCFCEPDPREVESFIDQACCSYTRVGLQCKCSSTTTSLAFKWMASLKICFNSPMSWPWNVRKRATPHKFCFLCTMVMWRQPPCRQNYLSKGRFGKGSEPRFTHKRLSTMLSLLDVHSSFAIVWLKEELFLTHSQPNRQIGEGRGDRKFFAPQIKAEERCLK